MKYRTLLIAIPLTFTLGCQLVKPQSPDQFLNRYAVPEPSPEAFISCKKFGCEDKSSLAYTATEWSSIRELFNEPSRSPEEERQAIRQAVALMESFVGAKNNTAGDVARNAGWFVGTPQLDCVAETINTTVALLLLEQNQLLQHHSVGYPRHRGILDLTGPHYSAVLTDNSSQQSYVVDSWFFANGQLPVVVSAEKWQKGYDPEDDQ